MTIEERNQIMRLVIAEKAEKLYPNDKMRQVCFISGINYALCGFQSDFDAKCNELEEKAKKAKYMAFTLSELENRIKKLQSESDNTQELTTLMCNDSEISEIQNAISKGYYKQ